MASGARSAGPWNRTSSVFGSSIRRRLERFTRRPSSEARASVRGLSLGTLDCGWAWAWGTLAGTADGGCHSVGDRAGQETAPEVEARPDGTDDAMAAVKVQAVAQNVDRLDSRA